MIKEEKITKEVTYTTKHKYCDDCGKGIKRDMACSVAICDICGKDLCNNCELNDKTGYQTNYKYRISPDETYWTCDKWEKK